MVHEREGRTVNRAGVVFREAIRELERRLPAGWRREDLAASIQAHFEETVRAIVGHWARATGLRDVAVAGGVFANVRVNEEVFRLPEVDRVFVHPGMTDGGLAVGSALAACAPGVLERSMAYERHPIPHVFLGTELGEEEVAAALREAGLEPEPLNGPLEEEVAELLAAGHVVARADGRMEYGPRALGNRSILYQPTDPSVNDWLNQNLQRTEFMPFAPAILWEERHRCFDGVEGAAHAAEFMTITFHCTPWMQRHMPGVVHVDGTARPQFVRQEANPGLHRILKAFHARTGLPGVINTSFNMHEEPIVRTAEDSVRAFLTGKLDYLLIGRRLVRHPAAAGRQRLPLERKARQARALDARAS
jgi:carbamoyltransferase